MMNNNKKNLDSKQFSSFDITKAQEIFNIQTHPKLRMGDIPATGLIASNLMIDPNDEHLRELYGHCVNAQMAKALENEDPFIENYPVKTSRKPDSESIILGTMPTGDDVFMEKDAPFRNIGVIGPTGVGKTELIKAIAPQLPRLGYRVLIFDRKHNSGLRDMAVHPLLKGIEVLVLKTEDLRIDLLDVPPGADEFITGQYLSNLISKNFRLSGYGRLVMQLIHDGMVERRQGNLRSFRGLLNKVRRKKAAYNTWSYQAISVVTSIFDYIMNQSCGIFDVARSDFVKRLFDKPGITIIELELEAPLFVLVASYISIWRYLSNITLPTLFVFEDITVIANRQRDFETPGGTAPLAELTSMGRSKNCGQLLALHTLSNLSPNMLNNIENLITLGMPNESLLAIQNLFNVDAEKAIKIKRLARGEMVARILNFHDRSVYSKWSMI